MARWKLLSLLLALPLGLAAAAAAPAGLLSGVSEDSTVTLFNAQHHTVLQLVGEWQVLSEGGVVRMRPVGVSGRVSLLELRTGLAQEHEVPLVGELVFGLGWIGVNRTDQETF